MKNRAGLLLLLLLSLFACNRIAQFREPIENLVTQWENTTRSLNELAGQVTAELTQGNDRLAEFQASTPSGPFADLLTPADLAQQEVQEQLARLMALQNELTETLDNWQTDHERVKALQSGLAEGTLPKDASSEIEALNQEITGQKSRLTNWEVQFETIQSDLQAALERLLADPSDQPVQ
jgi:DNA repair exonuclease SbcCD ATPase subunit